MASTSRVLVVTFRHLLAGIVAGALCGGLALLPVLFFSSDLRLVLPLVAIGAVIGGGVGALLGPVLSLGFLRGAPRWRVVCEPLLGAVLGAWLNWGLLLAGWFVAGYGLETTIAAAGIGAGVASWRLRRRTRRLRAAAS